MRVLCPMKTPMEITEPAPTNTPSTTSERAPMKQSSSMMVGVACSGSSTPPMPTPPERCTLRPIWAHEPHTARTQLLFAGGGVFERHLVVEAREPALHEAILAHAEGEEHRLLQPL